jgi:hypothetical protein
MSLGAEGVMDAGDADILGRYRIPRHRLTVAEFRRLAEVGVLDEDDRVELLEGQLVDMSPIGPRHALAVDTLRDLLAAVVAPPVRVRGQNPVTLDEGSEPQPDIALVRQPWHGYPGSHPGPADILLLVEVADSSLTTDTGAKRALYARAGIREFWVVDLVADVVRVHRGPDGEAYATEFEVAPAGRLEVEALPEVSIPAAPLFT